MDGWSRKAKKLREAGEWDELLTCCLQWTEEQPEEAKGWHNLGMGYVNLKFRACSQQRKNSSNSLKYCFLT